MRTVYWWDLTNMDFQVQIIVFELCVFYVAQAQSDYKNFKNARFLIFFIIGFIELMIFCTV